MVEENGCFVHITTDEKIYSRRVIESHTPLVRWLLCDIMFFFLSLGVAPESDDEHDGVDDWVASLPKMPFRARSDSRRRKTANRNATTEIK